MTTTDQHLNHTSIPPSESRRPEARSLRRFWSLQALLGVNFAGFVLCLRVPSSRPSVRFGCRGLHG
jgi:hypothetical protein